MQCNLQFLQLNGFGDKIIHAGLNTGGAIVFLCVRGHGDDVDRFAGLVFKFELTNAASGLESVEHGHLAIHEHDIKLVQVSVQNGLAVFAYLYLMAQLG